MRCPDCKARLICRLTLKHPDGRMFRRRKCECCGRIFYTEEAFLSNTDKAMDDIRMIDKMRKAGWNAEK